MCTAKVLTARMRRFTRTFAAHMHTEIPPVRLLSYINPFRPSTIFHPCQMDESVYNYRDVMYIIILTDIDVSYKQTAKTLMKLRIMRRLIWACTVCVYPIYGTLCLKGLSIQ